MNEVRVGPDPRLCPLCGAPNACALAEGRPDEPCWCARAPIPAPVLARLPAAARGVACVCARCAARDGSQPAS